MALPDVVIIDSGGANIASLQFALQRLHVATTLTTDADVIRNASHVILPGVGAAADAMRRLKAQKLDTLIATLKQPVLGICLGLHLLAEESAEQDTQCLGIVAGKAHKLVGDSNNRVPNMGWSRVSLKTDHQLLVDIDDDSYFYFLHSFALPVDENAIATSEHSARFTAILSRNNFYATQFHPERSAEPGAQLLRNFLALDT